MKISSYIPFAFLIVLMTLSSAIAETRYVSDVLVITVRDQKGSPYKTLETLKTAAPVKILDEDKTYARVKTSKGTVGFVLQQYISKKLPKATQIKQLKNTVADLKQQLEQLQQSTQENLETATQSQSQIDALTGQLNQVRQEAEQANSNYQQLLKDSDNIINLTTENEQLIEQNNLINSELLILREENQNFHRSNMIQWFIAGAGVFFGGWIIGKISRKKKRGFSQF